MLKTTISKALTTASVGAVAAGALTVVSLPAAQAYNGKEDPNTGIVWGVGQDGSYMVKLKSGGQKQGWCIDPGAAYPKQPGPYGSQLYGNPQPWKTNMSNTDKKKLSIALVLGKAIETGQVSGPGAGVIDAINNTVRTIRNGGKNVPAPLKPMVDGMLRDLPKKDIPKNANKIAAGVSGVVHDVGNRNRGTDVPPYTKPWNASRIQDPDAKYIYDLISKYAPLIPNQALPYVNFSIRKSVDNKRQRMVLMDDIKIDFKIPWKPMEFPKPNGGDDLSTTSTTPPTTPPTDSSTSTTPSTPPESSTTSSSSTTSTTPKEEEKKPEVRTSAGTKSENIVEQGKTITDTVTYKNLDKGEEYRLTGETVNKETGKKDGNKGEMTFKPKTTDGRVDVPIKLDKVDSDQLVVFETLEKKVDGKWEKVAEHADTNDNAQTVGKLPRKPQIATSAESSTGNNIQTGTTVNDTVRFQGLTPGKNYRLEAHLMCKETGADTGAVAQHQFTPDQSNGQTTVQGIRVTNPDCLEQVVFEKLYDDKGFLVAAHEDINDAAQTFGGEQPAKKKKKTPAPAPATKPAPQKAPVAIADANAHSAPAAPLGAPAPAPAPAGMGGAAPAPAPAPRQTIGSVPSGDFNDNGSTVFTR